MPWTTDDSRIKSLPKAARELWVKVANKYVADHGDSAASAVSAIRIAWSAVDKAGYKKGEGSDSHKWIGGEGVDAISKSLQPFNAPLSLLKAETKNGEMHIVLRASGPKVDRQDERMSPKAISKIIEKAKAGGVEMLDHHYASFPMAKSCDAWVDDGNGELLLELIANPKHPFVPMLIDDVQKGEHNYHTSVGGSVIKASWEYDRSLGKSVRVLEDVDVDHVAVTRAEKSAYPFDEKTSFVGAILKQLLPANGPGKEGESMNKILELLNQAAEEADTLMKGLSVQVTPDMFEKSADGAMVLKKEFVNSLKSAVSMTDEQKAEFGKSLASICAGVGIPLRKSEDPAKTESVTSPAAEGTTSATETATATATATEEANKAVVDSMVKGLAEQVTKATTELDNLKKSTATTASQLLKATLEVAGLKAEMAKMKAMPTSERPQVGSEALVRKGEGTVEVRPADNLEKGGEQAEEFVKSIESEADGLLQMQKARPWTADEGSRAQYLGGVLKVSKSLGSKAAFARFGGKK